MNKFAYTAFLLGLLLLYGRPRFPVPTGGGFVPPEDSLYTVNRLGPPHMSVAFPLHGMSHCALPSGAGPLPSPTVLPHPIEMFVRKYSPCPNTHGIDDVQHSPAYSVPAIE